MSELSTERIPATVRDNPAGVFIAIASKVAALIRDRQAVGLPCVLGLVTGPTSTGVYDELVRLHRDEGLSFEKVETATFVHTTVQAEHEA